MNIDPWIWTRQNALTKEFCESIIHKFEDSVDDQKVGRTMGGVHQEFKKSTDIFVTHAPNWQEEQRILHNTVTLNLSKYGNHVLNSYLPRGHAVDILGEHQYFSTGHQLQKSNCGEDPGFYTWHTDSLSCSQYHRSFTYIFYLNDVKKGGETEFINGTKVKPQQGKLLIFPATLTYVHRGVPPVSNDKYISVGWFAKQPWDIINGTVDNVNPEVQQQDMSHYIDYAAPQEKEDISNAFFLN